MFASSRKRKHRPQAHPTKRDERQSGSDSLHALYIQAYEADIVPGSDAAQSLEVVEYTNSSNPLREQLIVIPKIGSALIRWGGDTNSISKSYRDGSDEDDMLLPLADQDTEIPIWVDRYDARLLLDTLPNPMVPISHPDSPTGWSDLPSDTEDTFFFTPDETEDFRREKRRRLIEQTREERLKARMEEDHVEDEEKNQDNEDMWGGSDEEPDDSQQDLMRRTAAHLLSSPNAAQLEMRILANYGSDKRFAFLRGRWSRRWNLLKTKARLEKEGEKNQVGLGLGLVIGYGSDDDDDGDDSDDGGGESKSKSKEVATIAHSSPPAEPPDSTTVIEEAAKEARRKRAKEWAEKRREMRFKG